MKNFKFTKSYEDLNLHIHAQQIHTEDLYCFSFCE